MNSIKITLIASDQIFSIIPLLQTLNRTIAESVLQNRLSEMVEQGYQCVGIYSDKKLIGICGLWILTKYYVGKHIEPDNVVILEEYRGNGLGKQLMAWIYNYAKAQDCIASELNCYLTNEKGQQFWEKEGYKKIGYHYQKAIKFT
ncbi:GNAT family N-acetyltransferase [Methylobacter sp. S3L5C]|uniref:GNAT family N-acetyltransferase n=1 Tax=Methylobacter sp. S3L5C TaxID=2839024 RepID=UPI001FADEBC3|nr:GNAT family N-acetyltransferase [Methylobacter sp. S3L5C]UOA08525.1 GNAT family N-acetyltransferase [Methylobacter sp. S3L5C]